MSIKPIYTLKLNNGKSETFDSKGKLAKYLGVTSRSAYNYIKSGKCKNGEICTNTSSSYDSDRDLHMIQKQSDYDKMMANKRKYCTQNLIQNQSKSINFKPTRPSKKTRKSKRSLVDETILTSATPDYSVFNDYSYKPSDHNQNDINEYNYNYLGDKYGYGTTIPLYSMNRMEIDAFNKLPHKPFHTY